MKGWNLRSKRVFCAALFSLFAVLCLLLHRPILKEAGRFLAPASEDKAEVLILEGGNVVKNGALNVGMGLLSLGRANRLVVVLHQPSKSGQVFALQGKYAQLVIDELEHLGLKKDKVQVISAPIDGHPITLTEARFVVAKLSENKVRSAILLSEGFHSRRSYGVYRQEGARVGIRINPHPYFIGYGVDEWWKQTDGIHDFFNESLKLVYYIFCGHLSLKYL